MQPIDFEVPDGVRGVKLVLGKDQPEYADLPAFYITSEHCFYSLWKPTPEELSAIISGNPVELYVYSAGGFPPVNLRVNGVQYEGD